MTRTPAAKLTGYLLSDIDPAVARGRTLPQEARL